MRFLPPPRKRFRHDFSLTIINVVFLLLLFYLATGSLIKGVELGTNAPLTADLPLDRLPRPLLLLAADGSLFLDGAALAPADFMTAARRASEGAPFLNVLAERSGAGTEFLRLLAQLDQGGIRTRIVSLHSEGAGP
ncbi:MAG: biopolymer transporter ExbD [Mesorhizobium amorphae]|nr:MAG: biopolymer transporter ExbD [Mesorhizobium amorphae]